VKEPGRKAEKSKGEYFVRRLGPVLWGRPFPKEIGKENKTKTVLLKGQWSKKMRGGRARNMINKKDLGEGKVKILSRKQDAKNLFRWDGGVELTKRQKGSC